MLQLKLFGQFEVRDAVSTIDISNAKLRGLLAYLALAKREGETRDRLTALLWGSRFEKQADQSFRQALARLRKALAPDSILVSDRFVKLSPDRVCSDVARFEALVRVGSTEALRQSIELANGELMMGIDIREQAWEDWVSGERNRLAKLVNNTLLSLGELELHDGDPMVALGRGEAIVRRDFLREDAHRLIMRSLAQLGRRTEALAHYKELNDRLHKELGAAAEPLTGECYEHIKNRPQVSAARSSTAEREVRPLRADHALSSIVVLPFTNLSSDPEHEFFADGLTVDLITDLCRASELFVIAPHSSFTYKGRSVDVRTIARELSVRHILEGSVRRAGERVRINAQLVDAKLSGTLWADRFDAHISDLFAVQDKIAGKIVEALVGRLRVRASERRRTEDLEAYDLCVRARALFTGEFFPNGVREARLLLERAIALDPQYSEAYGWLAHTLYVPWWFGAEPKEPCCSLALAAAQKAIDLDPTAPAPHWMLGNLLAHEPDYVRAEAEFATALKLDPNNADAWAFLSELMVLKGRSVDALAMIEKAFRLNPYPPGTYYWLLGQAQFLDGQYERAIMTLRHETTYRTESRRTLAASLAQAGRIDAARQEADLFLARNPTFNIRHWLEATNFENHEAAQRFVEGYRVAGLPE